MHKKCTEECGGMLREDGGGICGSRSGFVKMGWIMLRNWKAHHYGSCKGIERDVKAGGWEKEWKNERRKNIVMTN